MKITVTRPLRLVLMLVLLAGIAAIIANFLSRRSPEATAVEASLLSPDIERHTTRFEYSEKEKGETRFRVKADKSTLRRDGVRFLEGVELVVFQEESEGFDRVLGEKALYRTGEKKIRFSGNVEMELSDLTRIHTGQVQADLDEQRILIDQEFQFQRSDVRGRGKSLVYDIEDRTLAMTHFRMEIPSTGTTIRARASNALYDLPEERLEMSGKAQMTESRNELAAQRLLVLLTPERRVRRVEGTGGSRLVTSLGREFSGDRIEQKFDATAGNLRSLKVFSGSGVDGVRAVYMQTVAKGRHRLEANSISVTPSSTGNTEVSIEVLEADGDVDFDSTPLSIERCTASHLQARFFPSEGTTESLALSGAVRMVRRLGPKEQQILESEHLQMEFAPGEVPLNARTSGPSSLRLESATRRQQVTAAASMEFSFLGGQVQKALFLKECRLVVSEAGEESRLEAPRIEARFENGRPDRVEAGFGVIFQSEGRRATGRTLEISYQNGLFSGARMAGDFRLVDPATGARLSAESALFDPAGGIVRTVDGSRLHELLVVPAANSSTGSSTTRASRFTLNRKTGLIDAIDRVESQLPESDGVRFVRAGRMSLDTGRGLIEYHQRPHLELDNGQITGSMVRIDQQAGWIEVVGEVQSSFETPHQDGTRMFRLGGERLRLDSKTRRAHYEEKAWLHSDDLQLEAPNLDLQLNPDDPDNIRELVAWGTVVARTGPRVLRGERAVYDPTKEIVVMTGQPATMTDPEEGTASGHRLIFSPGTDGLRIEGRVMSEKP